MTLPREGGVGRLFRRHLAVILAVTSLLLACPDTSTAQDQADATERRQMAYRVVATGVVDSVLVALVNVGEVHGMFVGASGSALSVYENGVEDRGGAEDLGRAVVILVEDSVSYVRVDLRDPTSPYGQLYQNDVIEIATDLTSLEYRSLFFDFVESAIGFMDSESELLFDRQTVLSLDSPEYESILLDSMAADVRATAEFIRPMIPDNPQWDITLEKGRFAGLEMVDAMAITEPKHVRAFLQFVRSFPGKYYGRDWKINETYATWLINAAPPGQEELLDSLLVNRGTARFEELLGENLDDLDDGVFAQAWNRTAVALAREGRIGDAYAVSDLVGLIASRLDNDDIRAHMLFNRADIAEEDDDYESSVAYYTESLSLFEDLGDQTNAAAAGNNLGLALNELDRYEEGLSVFDESIGRKEAAVAVDPSSAALFSLAGSYYGRGTSLASLGRLEEAVTSYTRADSLYRLSNQTEGWSWAARSKLRTATNLGKLGRTDEAIGAFTEAADLYEAMGDTEGRADVYDELALLLSRQGEKQQALETYQLAYELHIESGYRKDAGYSMSQIGQVYWQLGDYDQAIASHLAAIDHRNEANDRSGGAYSWLKLAELYKETGNPTEAIAAYREASEIYDAIGDRSGQADVLENLGDLYKREGDLPRAIQIHRRALEIRETLGALEAIATSLSDVADDYFKSSEYDSSWAYYERSADVRREIGDISGLAQELSNLGLIAHFHRRDYELSQEYYARAIPLAEESGSTFSQAFSHNGLARVHLDAGDPDAALESFNTALDLYSTVADKVNVLLAIGDIYRVRGEFDTAREYFDDAASMAREANGRHELANALNALGDLDRLVGDIASSLSRARQSLAIFQEVDNPWGIANARIGIGNTLNQMGANQLAIREYQIADSLYLDAGSELASATPANNIGTIYYHQGDFDTAIPYFERALKIIEDARIEDEFKVIITSNIGESHLEAGRYEEAEPWLVDAMALADRLSADRIGASVQAFLGKLYTMTGDHEAAEAHLGRAVEMTRRVGETIPTIDALTKLGDLYSRTDRAEEARAVLNEAIAIGERVGYARLLWLPLHKLGMIESAAGNPRAAIDYLRRSVDTIEDLRGKLVGGDAAKERFSSGERGDVYEALIAMLIRQGEVEEAMVYLERSNNQELRRRLLDLDVKFKDEEQAAAYERGRELESRLTQLQQRVASQRSASDADQRQDLIERLEQMVSVAESEYNLFVNQTLKGNSALNKHFDRRADPSQFFRSKDQIPEDAAVIAYLLGEESLYIFVATRESVTARVLEVSRDEVSALVAQVYEHISTGPGPGRKRAAGAGAGAGAAGAEGAATQLDPQVIADLYRILVAPIETEVYRKRNIAVMPSGHLYLLPFQILSRSGESRDALVNTHTVFYISDLDVFLTESEIDEMRLVAFGNADNSLPNAEVEVRDIADLFAETQIYLRDDATEARAKEVPDSYNVLHLATHGTLDFTDFENSYLTLATSGGDENDGRLTLGEIWGLSTLQDYRIVTLSACRSAMNDNFADGWPVSPARAFFDVGVSTVVASLWEVDDTATSVLMREFYSSLKEMGAAEALREAQRTLLASNEFSDPYYWAPFIVSGDWR